MKFFGYFKDGAIVQRSRPVLVRGRADGEVTCSLIGRKIQRKANGLFRSGQIFRLLSPCGGYGERIPPFR